MIEVTTADVEAACAYLDAGAIVFEQENDRRATTASELLDFLATEDPLFFLHVPAIAVMVELATTKLAEQLADDIGAFLSDEVDQ